MSQDPHELSAGSQQSSTGDPAQPLTRRELRAREARLAQEQHERDNPSLPTPDVVSSPVVAEVAPVVREEPVLMRRDRSNRPPLADLSTQVNSVEPVAELPDPVAAEANTPIVGMPVIASTVSEHRPVITEPPAVTAPLPAPIALIAQVSTPAEPIPTVKVRLKHKRRSTQPQIVAPKSRKRRGAQIFSMVAMAFVAGLAIATSVPANALLSPEQVALQAELARTSTLAIGDGQSVEGTGENVNAGRDGVIVSAAQAVPTAGAYAPKKLNVNVPLSTNGMRWPVDEVKISSPFGARSLWGTYNFHTGLDIDPAYGTPIYSVADGIVSLVENPGPTCGVAVFIEHNVDGTKFTSVYCHMELGSPTVTAGQTVKKGDFVGNIGSTGLTTGPHLHLEIRVADSPVDPYSFLVQHAGKASNEVRS